MNFFKIEENEKYTVCRPMGKIMSDEATDEFKRITDEIGASDNKNLIVTFEEATMLGSLAIGLLVRAQAHFSKNDGKIAFCCFPAPILEVLKMTRVNTIINTYETFEEAKKMFE
jgi:anti-anti-sigma factor